MNKKSRGGETPIVYKIVFMGDSGVGKTSLATRISCDTYNSHGDATIGASYFSKFIEKNNRKYSFNIWDTAGQEKYRCLVPLYYNNADAAIIVYDITNNISFSEAKKRVSELRKETSISVILFIGNKSDLEDKRQVSMKEATEYCEEADILFDETSAKLDVNVNNILNNILDKLPFQPECTDGLVSIIPPVNIDQKYCCY